MSKPRRKRKSSILDATLMTLAGLVILIGLGVWQLDRKVWKENLITTLNTRLGRAPEDLPPRASWAQLREDKEEFRRVVFPAEFLDGEEALVYTAGSPLRPDVKGPGYWVFAPARLAGGSIILVNRGFVPADRKDPGTRTEGAPHGVIDIVGVLRWPRRAIPSPRRRSQKQCLVPARFKFDCQIQDVGDRCALSTLIRKSHACRRPAETGQARGSVCLTITCNTRSPGSVSHSLLPASFSSGSRAASLDGTERFLVQARARGYLQLPSVVGPQT